MTLVAGVRFRLAEAADARAIAELHADSWRLHYRGAYSDSFLDGDVVADRLAVWTERLSHEDPRRRTIIAEDAGGLVGFANTLLDEDPVRGALLDNLHVAASHKRRGIGARLLRVTADALLAGPQPSGLYLWVLEQNRAARAFYCACGAERVGRESVPAPGGIASRLVGSPAMLRYAWTDASVLLGHA